MKTKIIASLPKPRKDTSVRFRSGSGKHLKTNKGERQRARLVLKKGQEVFQRVS